MLKEVEIDMKIKKIFELPILSSSDIEDTRLSTKGLNLKLELILNSDSKNIIFYFNRVLFYNFNAEGFIDTMDAYDKLVEIKKSDWLNHFKKINEYYYNTWNLKHYAIYLDSIGLYQFAAEEVIVESN